jgi:hypothetical protein
MLLKHSLTFFGCITTTLLLAGCGSGTTDQVINSITPPSLADAPGGHFYGYYFQTDTVDDLNSDVGGLYFSLPNSDGTWGGRMSFQFFDCQRTNTISLSNGQKLTAYLKTLPPYDIGTLDTVTAANPNTSIITNFSGSYSRTNDNYAGSYSRMDKTGDDHRNVAGCGSYTIADKGTWQVYKETQIFPLGFKVSQDTDLIKWTYVNNAVKTLIMIVDPLNVDSSNNALIRQIIVNPATTIVGSINVVDSSVSRNQNYLAVVEQFDASNTPVAFSTIPVKF